MVKSLIAKHFKKASEKLSKMTGVVEYPATRELTSFPNVFQVSQLLSSEQDQLKDLLSHFNDSDQAIDVDFCTLMEITLEVKAIHNQAAVLHGERIKRAQSVLKRYREGAFTAWLMQTYGNRQTPYNFLQYFELYTSLRVELQSKVTEMPRQVVYALASRKGSLEQKEEIIQNYDGKSKEEMLTLIRETFPLAEEDKRAQDLAELAIQQLKRLQKQLKRNGFRPRKEQMQQLHDLLLSLQNSLSM